MDAVVGTIATLISAIALIGVAVSVLMQARELRLTRIQTFRESQLEFVRMGLEDPALAMEFNPEVADVEPAARGGRWPARSGDSWPRTARSASSWR